MTDKNVQGKITASKVRSVQRVENILHMYQTTAEPPAKAPLHQYTNNAMLTLQTTNEQDNSFNVKTMID